LTTESDDTLIALGACKTATHPEPQRTRWEIPRQSPIMNNMLHSHGLSKCHTVATI